VARGGARAGAGRKQGQKSEKTLQREAVTKAAIERAVGALPDAFEGDSYAFLATVYKDKALPLGVRLDAAKTAIAYERASFARSIIRRGVFPGMAQTWPASNEAPRPVTQPGALIALLWPRQALGMHVGKFLLLT
jgi:hypothetical protein